MDAVAEATTLIKLNHGFGRQRVAKLNQELVRSLVKSRSIKARRIRIDSATLQVHISYPNDVGVVDRAVNTLTRTAACTWHQASPVCL